MYTGGGVNSLFFSYAFDELCDFIFLSLVALPLHMFGSSATRNTNTLYAFFIMLLWTLGRVNWRDPKCMWCILLATAPSLSFYFVRLFLFSPPCTTFLKPVPPPLCFSLPELKIRLLPLSFRFDSLCCEHENICASLLFRCFWCVFDTKHPQETRYFQGIILADVVLFQPLTVPRF